MYKIIRQGNEETKYIEIQLSKHLYKPNKFGSVDKVSVDSGQGYMLGLRPQSPEGGVQEAADE